MFTLQYCEDQIEIINVLGKGNTVYCMCILLLTSFLIKNPKALRMMFRITKH